MAIPIQYSSCFVTKKLYPLHPSLHFFSSTSKTRLIVNAELSEEPKAINESAEETSVLAAPSKNPNRTGIGFGSSPSGKSKDKEKANNTNKKKQRVRERASIIRRSPVEKPAFLSQQGETQPEEQNRNESAFLLTWLGLGSLILVEGILLAASGFLPEEWDKFFVKYLYPSFTPTVFLLVGGTVAYGVLKYMEGEKMKS